MHLNEKHKVKVRITKITGLIHTIIAEISFKTKYMLHTFLFENWWSSKEHTENKTKDEQKSKCWVLNRLRKLFDLEQAHFQYILNKALYLPSWKPKFSQK